MPNLQIQMTKKDLQSVACCYKYLYYIFIFANEFDSIERKNYSQIPSNEIYQISKLMKKLQLKN